jgi:pSer/pThr/pTyr-binding forkhead associated (FHA) protein
VYHLTRSDLIIGREQGDIVFSDDEFMSRRHALLQFRGNRALISDQGSSNGTYVRLTGQHILDPGQMIRLGDELLRFEPG